jgi:hypothetical protein
LRYLYTIVKDAVKGFFVTYANVFMEKLTAKARLVYLYFCRLASGENSAFPAHNTTAKACGLSVSATRAAIDELENSGIISREHQYRDNGGQKSNLYTFVVNDESTETKADSAPETSPEHAPIVAKKQGLWSRENNRGCRETANGTKHIITNIQNDINIIPRKKKSKCVNSGICKQNIETCIFFSRNCGTLFPKYFLGGSHNDNNYNHLGANRGVRLLLTARGKIRGYNREVRALRKSVRGVRGWFANDEGTGGRLETEYSGEVYCGGRQWYAFGCK